MLLLTRVDLERVFQLLTNSDKREVAIAFVLFGLSRFAEGVRLHIIIARYGFSLTSALRLLCISIFFNNAATMAVGDGYKLYALRQQIGAWKTPIALILLERLIGFFVVVGLGGFYVLLRYSTLSGQMASWEIHLQHEVAVIVVVCTAVVAAVGFLLRKWSGQLRSRLEEFWATLKKVFPQVFLPSIFLIILLTVISQMLTAVQVYVLVRAFHSSLFFIDTIFIISLLFIATYIPLSIGSLGVREGVLVLSLVLFGILQPVAAAVALVARLIIYVYAGLGACVFAMSKESRKGREAVSLG